MNTKTLKTAAGVIALVAAFAAQASNGLALPKTTTDKGCGGTCPGGYAVANGPGLNGAKHEAPTADVYYVGRNGPSLNGAKREVPSTNVYYVGRNGPSLNGRRTRSPR